MNENNNAVQTEDGIARLQMESQPAVPGDGLPFLVRDTLGRCTTINYRIGIDLRVLYLRFCRDGRFIIVGIN